VTAAVAHEAHLRGALERGGLDDPLAVAHEVELGLVDPLVHRVGVGRELARAGEGGVEGRAHRGVVAGCGEIVGEFVHARAGA
jgi:hypothetical protein